MKPIAALVRDGDNVSVRCGLIGYGWSLSRRLTLPAESP